MRLVTYREFSRLGKKRGWTVEMLAELFKGKIGVDDRADYFHESLKNYFERILTCRWLNPETRRTEDRSNVVIAYRSVIEFYERELDASEETESKPNSLTCELDRGEKRETPRHNLHGGERQGAGRKRLYQSDAEKKRAYRNKVSMSTKSRILVQ